MDTYQVFKLQDKKDHTIIIDNLSFLDATELCELLNNYNNDKTVLFGVMKD